MAASSRKLLWIVVAVGAVVRFLAPFYFNPGDHIGSETRLFLESSFHPIEFTAIALQEPPGYILWLSAVLRIIGRNHEALAFYAGLLSLLTPWCWYLFFRRCCPERALLGLALVSVLPSWIKASCYLLPETVLLPTLGLALAFTWQARQDPRPAWAVGAGVACGCCALLKNIMLPTALLICVLGLGRSAWKLTGLALLGLALVYSLGVLRVYNHTAHYWGQGQLYSRYYYLSGAKACQLSVAVPSRQNERGWQFEVSQANPSLDTCPLPFSAWRSARQGTANFTLDLSGPPEQPSPTWFERAGWVGENAIYFLLGSTQLGEAPDTWGPDLSWIWLPLTLYLLVTLRRPSSRPLNWICLGALLGFFLQQSAIVDGRTRLPWEGLALAALVRVF